MLYDGESLSAHDDTVAAVTVRMARCRRFGWVMPYDGVHVRFAYNFEDE